MLKMGTRAASFSAKIRNLQDYHHRLLNGLTPYPSSPDIINVLKFFSQALLTILRDIPCLPIDLIRDPTRDSVRIAFFPNLDFRNLHYTLSGMLDSFPSIQATLSSSAPTIFEYLLHALVCLVPFLEHEIMDSMPLIVANTISLNFISHQDIIDILCYNILPFTLYHEVKDNGLLNFANASIPSILMTVLSHTDSMTLHCQLLECLMRLKVNIIQDLLIVIAYGTNKARHATVELLFQYWPELNPSLLDRKQLAEKHVPWKPLTCQNETCQNSLNNEAVKICFAQIEGNPPPLSTLNLPPSIDLKGRPPIPLLICIECAELVREQNSTFSKSMKGQDVLLNVLHPITEISFSCESKDCRSLSTANTSKPPYGHSLAIGQQAIVTCFSHECTSFNSNKPVRLCAQCHQQRHSIQSVINEVVDGTTLPEPSSNSIKKKHLVQEHLRSFWQLSLEEQQNFAEAVISLLREASVLEKSSKDNERSVRTHGTSVYASTTGERVGGVVGGTGVSLEQTGQSAGMGTNATGGPINSEASDSTIEERQLLSRYGIWLLIGLVDPNDANTSERVELLQRMLAMLCQWFHNTACLPDDQAGSALERIKSESIHGWILKVIKSQFQLFANCLIPTPPEYAQIGGHWELWPSMSSQIKEGFKRLLCLVPYDIITADIWAYIMPFWMESFRYDLAEAELSELKILLSKVLDPDLSPLGLPASSMYRFISIRFEHPIPSDQEQALSWLQILTLLEIPIPISLLCQMFLTGIKSLANLRESITENINQTQFLKPYQETDLSQLSDSDVSEPKNKSMPSSSSIENTIESSLSCFVLMLDILVKQFEFFLDQQCHKQGTGFNDQNRPYCPGVLEKNFDREYAYNTLVLIYEMIHHAQCTRGRHTCMSSSKRTPETSQMFKPDSILSECSFCELCSIWYQLTLQLITLFAPVVEMAVSSVECSSPTEGNQDSAKPIPLNAAPTSDDHFLYSINEDYIDENESTQYQNSPKNTSVNFEDAQVLEKLDFNLTERLSLKFLSEIQQHTDPDVLYHLLQCLKLLTLHCGVLTRMTRDVKKCKFFQWYQKEHLITDFWRLLQAEFSQISQISVPMLLHFIALPGGLSIFNKKVNQEFQSEDWCVRFAAIERFATLSQFVEQTAVKSSSFLQSALSSLFIHTVQMMDDLNSAVAQRALLTLELMRASSLKLYVWCLELQFDLVIVDRCLMLSTLLQLFNQLNKRRILTWDFFLNRFDALFLEAQMFHTKSLGDTESGLALSTNDFNEPTRDLRNTNVHSETYKKKVSRAQEALAQIHLKRSLLLHHGSSKDSRSSSSFNILGGILGNGRDSIGAESSKLIPHSRMSHHQGSISASHRNRKNLSATNFNQQTAINRKSSKLAALTGTTFPNNFFQETGQSKQDLAQEENQLFNIVNRAIDEFDYCDQETLHLLVFLFMQFISWSDSQHPIDEKSLNRTQIIVFRHLNTLLGYSMSENTFLLGSYELRRKSIFTAFLTSLPDVLDLNLSVGNILLPTVFPVLIYSPANDRFIYTSDIEQLAPTYSLWLLSPHLRRSWLSSLIVILYKHDYTSNVNSKFVMLLIQIVINTLQSALEHRCSKMEQNTTAMKRRPSREQIVVSTNPNVKNEIVKVEEMKTFEASNGEDLDIGLLISNKSSTTNEMEKQQHQKCQKDFNLVQSKNSRNDQKDLDESTMVDNNDTMESKLSPLRKTFKKIKQDSKKETIKMVEIVDNSNLKENQTSKSSPSSSPIASDRLPSVERLLPVGGELPKSVRLIIERRLEASPLSNVKKSECCCCANSAANQSCCLNYQQTISAFQSSTRPQDLRIGDLKNQEERLLPIGPRPQKTFRSSKGTISRSVERAPATGKSNRKNKKQLTRQHTTIFDGSSLNNDSNELKQLVSSKSVDSNIDKPRLVTAKLVQKLPLDARQKIKIFTNTDASPKKEKIQIFDGPKIDEVIISPTKHVPDSVAANKSMTDSPSLLSLKSISSSELQKTSKLDTEQASNTKTSKPDPSRKPKKKTKKKCKKTATKKSVSATPPPPPPSQNQSSLQATSSTNNDPGSLVDDQPNSTKPSTSEQANWDSAAILSRTDISGGRSNDSTNSSETTFQKCDLCQHCSLPIEVFDEHEIGLCLITLRTFVHRDPTLAAPILPKILKLASQYAIRCVFPFQMESNIHLPGNTASIGRQFIRCTLHQLKSNGIFRQLFQTPTVGDVILYRSMAVSLADFVELNQVTPLKELFEALVDDEQLPPLSQILHTCSNVSTYLECVFVDYNLPSSSFSLSPIISNQFGAYAPVTGASIVANQPWSDLMTPLENYLRRLSFVLNEIAPNIHNLVPLMRVLLVLFKVPGIGTHRSIMEPVTRVLTHIIQHSPILLDHIRELCVLCSRAFIRDRDRMCVARTFANELIQALRFRTHLPDENIFSLVQWSLEDAGGSLSYTMATQILEKNQNQQLGLNGITVEFASTGATECLRCYIHELLEFIGDVHALAKFKSNFQGTLVHLNQETLGAQLKAGMSQFVAIELTRMSGSDSKAINKYLPWLYTLPSLQQGPKEFLECISHVRLLSWILLGSLQHSALTRCHPSHSSLLVSQPIPLEVSSHIAEHVQAILAGFAEQPKASVLHMSALFYAFLLCQLWTVYCEQLSAQNQPGSDASHQIILVLTDYWSKVTPGVLQLICHSKALSDTISLHFLSLMEALMECNSEILSRLIPLWLPLFNSYQGQLSDNIRVRLKTIVSWPTPAQTKDDAMMVSTVLIRWLQRIQTKISQIEMQSSTAIQFYCI